MMKHHQSEMVSCFILNGVAYCQLFLLGREGDKSNFGTGWDLNEGRLVQYFKGVEFSTESATVHDIDRITENY